MDKNSLHFRGTYRNVYEVNRAYPNGGVDGDYVDINGWQHWWNPDRGTWCVNENRDSYWDEVLSTVQNLLFSKACVSESDFPLNPTDEEKRFGYFYNGELYLWTGTNGTVRNGQYRSFGVVQGERGVGVSSIAQTSTSNVDGGKNEITVTLTNGDSYKFFTYNGTGRNKGYYYRTLDELKQAVPSPTVTDWAIVDGSVYVCDEAGVWKDTTYSWKPIKLNPFVTELNKMDMPTSTGYLYWNGQSFGWKTPVVNNGGGNTGGGTSIDLSEYSWWGRKFAPASKMITGEMSAVTSIEFQSTKGETTIKKKLYLDENGDLCFNGNLYATGGITALGSGGGTSGGSGGGTSGGGSGVSLGTLLTKLNSENPFPTASGQVLTYDGSNFVWETPTGSGGSLKPLEVVGKDSSTFFVYNGETRYRLRFGSGLSMKLNVDEYVVTANGGSSSTLYPFTIYNGSSDNDYITYDGSSAAYLKFKSGFSISKVGLGYEISATGSGGSSGGSSGSVDLSNYLTKTDAASTYAAKIHTHSAASITGFEDAVKLVKVDKAALADKATQLANTVTLWGNNFSGNNSIGTTSSYADLRYVKDIYAGKAFDIKAGNNSLLSVNSSNIHVGFGYMANANASLLLFGNKTTIYTSGDDYRYDFKGGVFDVNTNTIHFGPEAGGGKISWDRANNAFKIEGNVYATGGITALGVNNSANNLDFTFKSVTAKKITIYASDNYPFQIYPEDNTETPLKIVYTSDNSWNIVDDNGGDIRLQDNCSISIDGWVYSPQFRSIEQGNMVLNGYEFSLGSQEVSVSVIFYHSGNPYKLDMSKAISLGVFTAM